MVEASAENASTGGYPWLRQHQRARDIVHAVEDAVEDGLINAGDVLPPVRALASDLGISPATVASAYQTLNRRGLIEVRGRRTVIRTQSTQATVDRWWIHKPPNSRLLSLSLPAADLTPRIDEAVITRALSGYGHPIKSRVFASIDPDLAAVLAAWYADDGVPADHLTLSSGHLDGLKRALTVHLRTGDTVALEDPNEDSILSLVRSLGFRVVGITTDNDGPEPASLRSAIDSRPDAVIVTSRAHHPTGASVTEQRAAELRDLLRQRQTPFLIDLDRGFGTTTEAPHTLVNSTRHWVLIRILDAAYGADLRISPLAGDKHTMSRIRVTQRSDIEWTSFLLQRILVELWNRHARIVDHAATVYTHRREILIDALQDRGIAARARAGLDVWAPLPTHTDEMGTVIRLMNAGWVVAPSQSMRINTPPGLRITIADLHDHETQPFANALDAALKPEDPPSNGVLP